VDRENAPMERAPRVLLIDNIDSFTFNVADLLHRVTGVAPTVWRHDHPVPATRDWWCDFDAIVIGPGPGAPSVAADMGLSVAALQQQAVPLLGVCLGHQGIGHHRGYPVAPMQRPRHGIVSPVRHDGSGLFAGLPSPLPVVRYHSLALAVDFEPQPGDTLRAVAWAGDDEIVMALADPERRRWGVQFHPESVRTEHGDQIVRNFFAVAGVYLPPSARAGGALDRPGEEHTAVALGDVLRARPPSRADGRAVQLAVHRWRGAVSAPALHARLFAPAPGAGACVWLDSSNEVGISVMADPSGPLGYTLEHRVGEGTTLSTGEHRAGPLWDTLEQLLDRVDLEQDADAVALPFDFRPGFVGYFGYELKAETGGRAAHRARHPDAWLAFVDRAVVVDHTREEVVALALVDEQTRPEQTVWMDAVGQAVERVQRSVAPPPPPTPGWGDPADDERVVARAGRHTETQYHALIAQAQQSIRAGDSYEVCLTNDIVWPHAVQEGPAYQALRRASPVPHAAWLRCGEFSVLSASPERFVSVSADGRVRAEPIKGTRARHEDPASDAQAAADLAADAKERAENLMIVDLLRNDLHRVCRAGSVSVPSLFEVRSWATVHQLVSVVAGSLAPGRGPVDVLRACFPGGSMTGAPKVRTMELLDDLEAGPRGIYSGALGWLGLNGAMDTSIVIRSLVLQTGGPHAGRATFGVGGAITALSDPADEYAETLLKARGIASALRQARNATA
jgi:para-aminobenzoate synthetase